MDARGLNACCLACGGSPWLMLQKSIMTRVQSSIEFISHRINSLRQLRSGSIANEGNTYETLKASNRAITDVILSKDAFCISRFGSTELRAIRQRTCKDRYDQSSRLYKMAALVRCLYDADNFFWYDKMTRRNMCHYSGFYPTSTAQLDRYTSLVMDRFMYVTCLAEWIGDEEKIVSRLLNQEQMKKLTYISLESLDPFWVDKPWTQALRGKKVLVVHPFASTIDGQIPLLSYIHKENMGFSEIKFSTYAPYQSLGDEGLAEGQWFENLMKMHDDISSLRPDLVLIAAGAYGMPLALLLRESNISSIHAGGSLQLWFGIHGNRWINNPKFQKLFNEYWTNPSEAEKPCNWASVESGCYWR